MAKTFGQTIKAARLNMGLTLTEAARALGLSVGNLGDIESGRRKPPKDTAKLRKMETLLGFMPGDLVPLAELEWQKVTIPPDVVNFIRKEPQLAARVMREAEAAISSGGVDTFLKKLEAGD